MKTQNPMNMPQDEVGDYIQAALDDTKRTKVLSFTGKMENDGTWTVTFTT